MKALPETPIGYFEKFNTDPVAIVPFDPRSAIIAAEYIDKLKEVLSGLDVAITHRGSTVFRIAGKGDVELGVFPEEGLWETVLEKLETLCGSPGNTEQDYVRFNDVLDGFEIEIIVLNGRQAIVDRRLTEYLLDHPALLMEYEQVKRKHAYSKRQYQKAKDKFLRAVIEMIPEEQEGG
jgi:GrpB-like predicted nucleotidyltransferase (UPF0157 family)